jgi:hypothetical protein
VGQAHGAASIPASIAVYRTQPTCLPRSQPSIYSSGKKSKPLSTGPDPLDRNKWSLPKSILNSLRARARASSSFSAFLFSPNCHPLYVILPSSTYCQKKKSKQLENSSYHIFLSPQTSAFQTSFIFSTSTLYWDFLLLIYLLSNQPHCKSSNMDTDVQIFS